jgi:hypothetical protein
VRETEIATATETTTDGQFAVAMNLLDAYND